MKVISRKLGFVSALLTAAAIGSPVLAQGSPAAKTLRPAYCTSGDPRGTLITDVFMTNMPREQHRELKSKWAAHTASTYGLDNPYFLDCQILDPDNAERLRQVRPEFIQRMKAYGRSVPQDVSWRPSDDVVATGKEAIGDRPKSGPRMTSSSKPAAPKPELTKPTPTPAKYVEVAGPDGPIRLSPEVAARNQAAADEYRRKMEEHARAVAAHDQTLAKHRQNAAAAASAKEQHDREVAAAAERVAAHRLALAEHAKKVAAASTDEDPNRCITSPAIKPGLRGNTEVHVTNGCGQKVDIVICLKRTSGDWLCGAQFGILSQRSMSFMSTNATGEIYVDAVTFGSNNKLGRPAGIIK